MIQSTQTPTQPIVHSRDFRPLSTLEMKTVLHMVQTKKIPEDHTLMHYLDSARVSYENMQGGFCVCIIIVGNILWRGASRRSYKDPRKPIRGELLAFSRALLYSHAIEI